MLYASYLLIAGVMMLGVTALVGAVVIARQAIRERHFEILFLAAVALCIALCCAAASIGMAHEFNTFLEAK